MARTVSIGNQDFESIRSKNYFYVDKTRLIKEWWERGDSVTLITRPRRFGKSLNMSMLEKFFSVEYAGREDLFKGLCIWEEEKYRALQGTYPVIMLSFAKVKETTYRNAQKKMFQILATVYNHFDFLLDSEKLNEREKEYFRKVSVDMEEYIASDAIGVLSEFLFRYYGKKVIILLDEYDTPMQEAYVNGYWEELVSFTRSLFNATFKTNPYLECAIMTGITRVSRESMFSDLNNLKVVTATAEEYADSFGFTEEEVFMALDEFGLSDRKEEVKYWYDGFIFGSIPDIYNPWSIVNYLDTGKLGLYWINTSSNSLAGKLVQEGSPELKMTMEKLLRGETFSIALEEQIVFSELEQGETAVWSLLLASGYLKAVRHAFNAVSRKDEYELKLTNLEVQVMFERIIEGWFGRCRQVNNAFLKALLAGDLKAMNTYMNKVALQTFSYFDTGANASELEPERFYHGFVLGMMVELADKYVLTSNRESGFGRYDVMLEPRRGNGASNTQALDAIIIEFKVQDSDEEAELADTVKEALNQIEEKQYEAVLQDKGIAPERIKKYGFAFSGKKVLIGTAG
ncbi:MAG: ATP-binding protein [Acetatifactor sp.]|nr:ATP-binding protein [Acetatifactor sp.]